MAPTLTRSSHSQKLVAPNSNRSIQLCSSSEKRGEDHITMKKMKILIAGGGFAGLYAAKYLDKRLARRPDIEVTLISRENFILFTPMLHEVAAGELSPSDIVNPLRRILRHVNVVEAEVDRIDLAARKIHCRAGVHDLNLEFEFDH